MSRLIPSALSPARSLAFASGPALVGALLVVLSLAGAGLASYLAVENLQGQSGVCTGVAHGCATVQQSAYGKLAGVPVSLPGALLYGLLVLIALAWSADWRGWRPSWAVAGAGLAFAGFAFSMYLTAIEAFVLDTWCIYCVASALLMTALAAAWGIVTAWESRRL